MLLGGYLFAYMDNVITTSAGGSDAPPSWPDFSDFYSDVVGPFLRWVAAYPATKVNRLPDLRNAG